jgi:hypothetical protein
MHPAKTWHVSLTRLVPPVRGGRWLCAAILLVALTSLFGATGLLGTDLPETLSGSRAGALFFAVIVAYIVPVFHFISQRTAEAVASLQADLDLAPGDMRRLQARIYHKPQIWFAVVLGIGGSAALIHNLMLAANDPSLADAGGRLAWWAVVAGSSLVWIVMTLVVAALLDNAFLLNRLARRVRIHVLNPERLRPFGNVAVLSTLSLIGAQAAFPILMLGDDPNPVAFVPGLAATAVPMVILALLPVWPLHVRLRAERRRLLAHVNERIARSEPAGIDLAVDRLLPLLAWRRELLAATEWPVDGRSLGRLAFYLVIPPLTWIGAALVENLVETLL